MTSKCVTCLSNLPNETLYRCQTCHREQDEASGFEYFCENCLVSHIRKGHSVIDCKGDKPLICSEHSLICLEYCKTCDVTFCYKCLGSHSKHEFEAVSVNGLETVENHGRKFFYIPGSCSIIYRIEKKHSNEIKFAKFGWDQSGPGSMSALACFERFSGSVEVTHAFCFNENQILILMKDRTAKIYSSDRLRSCSFPQKENYLWPYGNSCSPDWSYWNAKEKKVRFTHSADLWLNCDKCPKIKMSSSKSSLLCFFDSKCDINYVNTSINSIIKIPKEVHGFESIDCFSALNYERLLVWKVATKEITSLQSCRPIFGQVKFDVKERIYWNDKPEVFWSVDRHYLLYPVLKSKLDMVLEDTFIFAVRFTWNQLEWRQHINNPK